MIAALEQAFYPLLFMIFVIASLGVPIPEDIPLIAAGVILRIHPGTASWTGTLLVSLIGIMSGDIILYTLGRRWGRDVFAHRSVAWLITPDRLASMSAKFARHGVWMVFVGRLFMGVRAVMCLTAGVTHFPFWKFLLADVAGAIVSIPLFVGLGYFFAHMLDTLREYIADVQIALLVAAVVAAAIIVPIVLVRRRRKRLARQKALADELAGKASGSAASRAKPEPVEAC